MHNHLTSLDKLIQNSIGWTEWALCTAFELLYNLLSLKLNLLNIMLWGVAVPIKLGNYEKFLEESAY